ncbi:hypothetical protein AB0D14_09660 [Streptomyces sp. NPDC048484]|uniref:hypothetical protein n=1 Tax=Streptomyces sp. NPDC048484 TaxID=3155146 RepID=UPI0034319D4D
MTERQKLETAAVILGLARPMLDGVGAPPTADQLHWIAGRLAESLTEVLALAAGRTMAGAVLGHGT